MNLVPLHRLSAADHDPRVLSCSGCGLRQTPFVFPQACNSANEITRGCRFVTRSWHPEMIGEFPPLIIPVGYLVSAGPAVVCPGSQPTSTFPCLPLPRSTQNNL